MSGAPRILGHYRILSRLGEGGMGEVYLAEDTQLDRRVAIKILPDSSTDNPEAKRRMLREARAVAALDHPNVCAVYEVGEHEGRPYIVMQYIEGKTLFERLQHSRVGLTECLDIAVQLASALEEAHNHGIVHRDIKTMNTMITTRGHVKVLDFGLARLNQPDEQATAEMLLSQPGMVAGTAPYMSPEQLRGMPVDARSDIFSFGVVLYEMAAGRRPFDRDTTVATITAVLFEEPPPIGQAEFKPLAPILRRALAKDPAKRYPNATVLREALQAVKRPKARTRRSMKTEAGETGALPSSRALDTPRPRTRIDSLAVLSLGSDAPPELEYLGFGLNDAIVSALSQLRKLRVTAATTARRDFQGALAPSVGQELGVAAIVGVRSRVESDRLYVDVELIATADGERLWGSQYMRPIQELAAMAEAIAADIGEQVRVRGSTAGPRRAARKRPGWDAQAHQLFLKGRFQWIKRVPEALKLSMSLFQQAVEQDPSFAPPYSGLADGFVMLGFMQALPPPEILPKAKAAAARAIELDPTLADPHATLGYAAGLFEWDWEAARRELEEAMRLNPSYPWAPHWLGLLACGRGQTDYGLELIERARALDPLSPIINIAAGIPLHIARRYDEAAARYRHVLETETSFAPGHYYLAMSLIECGHHDEALRHARRVLEIAGPAGIYLGFLANALGRAGRVEEAEAIIEQMRQQGKQRYVSPHPLAIAYAGLERHDEAIGALEGALQERNAWMWFFEVEPRFDRLRADPRVPALARQYGLPPLPSAQV